MSPRRILGSIVATVLGITLLGACSTDSFTEGAVNFGLEQAIEGNEDIDVDFGGDGAGGISISTEEGDFALSFDEDNGGITFDTDEGDGSISFDEDGIVFDTDAGDGVISFDEDAIVFDTDAGDGVISFDEDNGTVSFEGDAGSAAIGGNQVPENWPAAIGIPQTVNTETMAFTTFDLGEGGVLTGVFEHAAGDPFAADAADALVATGWVLVNEAGDADHHHKHFRNEALRSTAAVIADGPTNTIINIATDAG